MRSDMWRLVRVRTHPEPGHKLLPTLRTLDSLKVDAPHLGRRNHAATFGTRRVQ
jgi:hypothetical protein